MYSETVMNRLLLAAVLSLGSMSAQATVAIFACEPEWGALAREIGGPDVEVYTATNAYQDPHRIEARPSLIARYRKADLLVCTGADLESGWLPALAQKGNNPRLRPGQPGYFEAAGEVEMLGVPEQVDRSMGDVHPWGNPHIQTDPRQLLPVAAGLGQRLMQIDPARAKNYQARHAAFASAWTRKIASWEERAAPLRGQRVISAHDSWAYLYAWLGLEQLAVLEAKPGVPPSTGQLLKIVETLQNQPAKMVLYAAYQSDRPARWIAARTGIPAVALPFTVGGAEGAEDLSGLYEVTLRLLLDAL